MINQSVTYRNNYEVIKSGIQKTVKLEDFDVHELILLSFLHVNSNQDLKHSHDNLNILKNGGSILLDSNIIEEIELDLGKGTLFIDGQSVPKLNSQINDDERYVQKYQ